MKDLVIKNINDIEPKVADRSPETTFSIRKVVGDDETDTYSAAFIEVPAGKYAFGYHFHDQSEECFYVVSGQGILRNFYGETPVKAGDMMCFPTGEKGAHVLTNSSDTEPLIFIDFDVKAKTDIVTFPDTGKVMVRGIHTRLTVENPV